ncbi:MAG: ABC transporter ATP-binding protein [Alphaproteobacteria bacterium]
MSQTPDLDVRGVVKRFGDFTAVNEVSFTVSPGSFFSILGPSGCGKTTLMRMIAGFTRPEAGDILIKGESMRGVPPNRLPANMVFQHLALFPMMTVAQNIGYGLRRRRLPKREIHGRVEQILERVGLAGEGDKDIDQLSGGQKQRVAIARCLILEPALLLLDEPLGALDLKLREQMKVELKQLQAKLGTTFVYITHDQSEALVMSDHVAVMNRGRFEQVGTPQELYYRPQTAFVAGFVGNSNRWNGRIAERNGGQVRVRTDDGMVLLGQVDAGLSVGDAVEVFVRPEAITLSRGAEQLEGLANHAEGSVENLLFDGANSTVMVSRAGAAGKITVALPQTGHFADLKTGEWVYLGWGAESSSCFAANEETP